MQTVHEAHKIEGDIKYGAVGILFSVNNYTKEGLTNSMVEIIDKFFESL